jgi:hypothetical protein
MADNPDNNINPRNFEAAAWFFSLIILFFCMWVIVFIPDIPPVKQKMIGVLLALLSGFAAFFFIGSLVINTPKIQSAGGIAVFIFVLVWWNSVDTQSNPFPNVTKRISEIISPPIINNDTSFKFNEKISSGSATIIPDKTKLTITNPVSYGYYLLNAAQICKSGTVRVNIHKDLENPTGSFKFALKIDGIEGSKGISFHNNPKTLTEYDITGGVFYFASVGSHDFVATGKEKRSISPVDNIRLIIQDGASFSGSYTISLNCILI